MPVLGSPENAMDGNAAVPAANNCASVNVFDIPVPSAASVASIAVVDASSNTVSAAGVIAVDTKVLAFVGDFSTIRWGVQKSINLEVIEFGDPDGGGDLKRTNEVAFRSEVVYGWGVANLDAFAKIHDLA